MVSRIAEERSATNLGRPAGSDRRRNPATYPRHTTAWQFRDHGPAKSSPTGTPATVMAERVGLNISVKNVNQISDLVLISVPPRAVERTSEIYD